MKIQWRSTLMSLLFAFSNVVYLNLLWILFCLLGLGILGFAPATIALMKCYGNFSIHGDYVSLKVFYAYYKEHFKSANIMQFGFVLATLLLLLSSRILVVFMEVQPFIPFFYLFIVLVLILVNFIALQSFEWYPAMKGLERFKFSLFLFLRYPWRYLPVILTLFFAYQVITLKVTFILLGGISLPIALVTYLHKQIIQKFQTDFPNFGMMP